MAIGVVFNEDVTLKLREALSYLQTYYAMENFLKLSLSDEAHLLERTQEIVTETRCLPDIQPILEDYGVLYPQDKEKRS